MALSLAEPLRLLLGRRWLLLGFAELSVPVHVVVHPVDLLEIRDRGERLRPVRAPGLLPSSPGTGENEWSTIFSMSWPSVTLSNSARPFSTFTMCFSMRIPSCTRSIFVSVSIIPP